MYGIKVLDCMVANTGCAQMDPGVLKLCAVLGPNIIVTSFAQQVIFYMSLNHFAIDQNHEWNLFFERNFIFLKISKF